MARPGSRARAQKNHAPCAAGRPLSHPTKGICDAEWDPEVWFCDVVRGVVARSGEMAATAPVTNVVCTHFATLRGHSTKLMSISRAAQTVLIRLAVALLLE